MRGFTFACAAVLALSGSVTVAQTAPAAAAATTPFYTTSGSQMGTLLDNPATRAVLTKHLPELMEKIDEMRSRVEGMTLKELQGVLATYAPTLLTNDKLKAIDADLASIPEATS